MMLWYDGDGPWTITAFIEDLQSASAQNGSTNLTLAAVTGFVAGGEE